MTIAYTFMLRFNSPTSVVSCSRPAAVKVFAGGLCNVSTATVPSIAHSIMTVSAAKFSFQADGGVDAGSAAGVVEPARGNGLGLRVELHHLFAVGPKIAELRAARSGKAENRHRHGNRHVDPHLTHVDLVLKFARYGAALREN